MPQTNHHLEQIDQLDYQVLHEFPYPLAINYRRILDAGSLQEKALLCLGCFDLSLRAITIQLLIQYLRQDREEIEAPELDHLLLSHFPHARVSTWKTVFFQLLRAYQGQKKRLYAPELYELYWDRDTDEPRSDVDAVIRDFDVLVQATIDFPYAGQDREEDTDMFPIDDAGWEPFCNRVLGHFRSILQRFVFLTRYELIKVTAVTDEGYQYDSYTGQKVRAASDFLPTVPELVVGQFYLRGRDEPSKPPQQLHPLVFGPWPDIQPVLPAIVLGGVPLYHRYSLDSVIYTVASDIASALTPPIEIIEIIDAAAVNRFLALVRYSIQGPSTPEQKARLTWNLLGEIAYQICADCTAAARARFRRDVYLPRKEAEEAFKSFINSPYNAFVLLGKSGVGKSNFLIATADEYQHRDDVCVIMYDAHRLPADRSLMHHLAEDLAKYVDPGKLLTPLGELDGIGAIQKCEDDILHKLVILILDAVNEHDEPSKILKLVDKLLRSHHPSWLKVVISSRPHAWNEFKRQISERYYYRMPEQDEVGFVLQPFTEEELKSAYANYQRAYSLRTPFTALDPEVRHLFRDPLALKLMAHAYKEGEIPDTLRATGLINHYVDQLRSTEWLRQIDIDLLQYRIMPLMLNLDYVSNSLTRKQIMTSPGELDDILDLDNPDRLSNGRRVNEPYRRLTDAEILAEEGGAVDKRIQFKYERFYDYFAGERMYHLCHEAKDVSEAFRRFIEQISEHPYLWGPVHSALLRELKDSNESTLISLADTDQQATKELVVSVLHDYGHDEPERVAALANHMWKKACSTWALFDRQRMFNIGKAAIEVASGVGAVNTLEEAACTRNDTLRAWATRHIYYLWKRNPNEGVRTLKRLSNRINWKPWGHARQAFESCLGASLLIMADSLNRSYQQNGQLLAYRNPEIVGPLRDLWREIINRLFLIGKGGRSQQHLRAVLRNAVLRFAIGVAYQYIGSTSRFTSTFLPDIWAFFGLPQAEKERYERLVDYIDPEREGLATTFDDILAAAEVNDMLTANIVWFVLVLQGTRRPKETLELTERLLEAVYRRQPDGCYYSEILYALTFLLRQVQGLDPRMERHMFEVFRDHMCHRLDSPLHGIYYRTPKGTTHTAFTNIYTLINHKRYDGAYPNLAAHYCRVGLEEPALQLLDKIIHETRWLASTFNEPRLALDTLDLLLPLLWPPKKRNWDDIRPTLSEEQLAQARDWYITFLAQVRLRDQYAVDGFLLEHGVPHLMRQEIAATEINETIWEDLLFISFSLFAAEIFQDPELNAILVDVYKTATRSRTATDWFLHIARTLVDLIYGGDLSIFA